MVQLSTLLVLAVSTLAVTSKPVAIDGNMSSAKVHLGTNAERIAQGMSPLPPTKRSTGMLELLASRGILIFSCQGQAVLSTQ